MTVQMLARRYTERCEREEPCDSGCCRGPVRAYCRRVAKTLGDSQGTANSSHFR